MITYFQAIILGTLQGITELFPISSLGHSVVLPKALGWNLNQSDPFFLTFLVATHLATALVLLVFFWSEWVRIARGMGRSLQARYIAPQNTAGRLGWLLVVGTIPAGVLGLLLEEPIRSLFASPRTAAFFLMINGLILFGAEALRRRAPGTEHGESDARMVRSLNWAKATLVGAVQALALIPGISRSGAAMSGGLLSGLSNEDAARYSFLLATPIIGAAAVLKLPELLGTEGHGVLGQALVGAIFAGIAAYFSVKFLLRYFQTNRLTPFGVYCLMAGLISLWLV